MNRRAIIRIVLLTSMAIASLIPAARGANVTPAGYTNAFATQPPAADWATVSVNGAAGDTYDMDVDVNARIAATNVTTQVSSSATDPVGLGLRASWSSSGLHLATRPNGNRYAVLIGKFRNDTGSNATGVAISLQVTLAGNAIAEDAGKGTRVYYSLTGQSNAWVNLPSFNTTATNGTSTLTSNLTGLDWRLGEHLYLMWVDDNAAAGNDVAHSLDNFSLFVTGTAPLPVAGSVVAPTHGAVFVAGTLVAANVGVTYGVSPYVVRYFTNSGAGNTTFTLAGSVTGQSSLDLSLGALPIGTYNLYATVTDQNDAGDVSFTETNTFAVAAPLDVAFTSPAEVAEFDQGQSVNATVALNGGTPPYSAQFILNGTNVGQPVVAPPYSYNYGSLPIGFHTLAVRVTDQTGWTSNSTPRTIRVTGPLSAVFTPTNNTVLNFGSSLQLDATLIGGEPPYTVSFRTNGVLAATLGSPPFSTNLGVLAPGTYAISAHITDSSLPAQQIEITNTITFLSLPVARATHAVQISLDGLGAKYLEFFLTNAPQQFPNFVRLTTEGAFTLNARCDFDVSETVPNHATMFTGRPVMQPAGQPATAHHGYNNNFPGSGDTLHISGNVNIPYKASIFDVTHDYGLRTALFTGKTRLAICERSYNATNGAPDVIGADNGRDKIDFSSVADVSGANISAEMDLILQNLNSGTPPQYSFIHIAEPDLTGHASGWRSANWSNMVRLVDAELGRLLQTIDTHPLLSNRTALIITADHGGGGVLPNAHTEAFHITNYTVPFFVRAPGIPGGKDIYELFSNRGNPGTNRTDYNTQPQPVRNADASNLSLQFLGLPPIPGSLMAPTIAQTEATLSIARYEGRAGIFWSDPSAQFVLEWTATLGSGAAWQTVTNGIETNETTRVLTVTNTAALPARFFRLRKGTP
jgi:hypothetical protein